MYVMTGGEVVIIRGETAKSKGVELVRLHPPTYFGESSLLTGELRKATVRAGPAGASLLRLSRQAFLTLGANAADADAIKRAREAVTGCLLFCSLRVQQQQQIFRRMKPVSFRPGEFIVNEGETGQNVYVIVEGQCAIVSDDTAQQKDLGTSSCFGEKALYKKPNQHSIIARSSVSCMKLASCDFHPDFTHLLRKMMPNMNSKARRASTEKEQEIKDQSSSAVASFGWHGSLTWRQRLVALGRTIIRTLRNTVYSRLYNDVIACDPEDPELGRLVDSLSRLDEKAGLAYISEQGAKVLNKLPYRRSALDMSVIGGLVARSWCFHTDYCKDWPATQLSGLYRTLRFERVLPLEFIYEQGAEAYRAYILMSGFVRLRRWVLVNAQGVQEELAFGSAGFDLLEDDAIEVDVITLGPGDTFGREALPPPLSSSVARPRRHSCITGATAEVIVVDHNDFQRARDQGCREMTFEQKVQCLRRAAMLKHWDLYRLHRLAYAMQERHYPKDKALATEGTTKDTLVCIVSGTAILHIASDSSAARVAAAQAAAVNNETPTRGLPRILSGALGAVLTAPQLFGRHPIKLLTVGDGDYFGDSGLINYLSPAKKRAEGLVVELCSTVVVSAELISLELPTSEFALFDERDLRILLENRRLRQQWRSKRLAALARTASDRVCLQGTEPRSLWEHNSPALPRAKSVPLIAEASQSGVFPQALVQRPEEETGEDHPTNGNELNRKPTPKAQPQISREPATPAPVMISRCGLAHSMVEGVDPGGRSTEQALLAANEISIYSQSVHVGRYHWPWPVKTSVYRLKATL